MDLLVYRVSGLALRGGEGAGKAAAGTLTRRGRAVIKIPSVDIAANIPEDNKDRQTPPGQWWKGSEDSDSEEGRGESGQSTGDAPEARGPEAEVGGAHRPWPGEPGRGFGPRPQSTGSNDGDGGGDRDGHPTWMGRLRDEERVLGPNIRWADSADVSGEVTPPSESPGVTPDRESADPVFIPKLDLQFTPESSLDHASLKEAFQQTGLLGPWRSNQALYLQKHGRPPGPPSPSSDKGTARGPAGSAGSRELAHGASRSRAVAQSHCRGKAAKGVTAAGSATPERSRREWSRIQELEYLAAGDEDLSSPEDDTYFTGEILNISLSFGGTSARGEVPADIPRIMLTEDEDDEEGSL